MRFESTGLGESLADYQTTWDRQREIHGRVREGTEEDTVLLVEHADVYTAGKRTSVHDRPQDGTPVIDVDRGGRITWHGPGQLVAYPIVALREPVDVVAYVRALEQAAIDVCAALGLTAGRVEGRSGVWFAGPEDPVTGLRRDRKVAAIGARVASGVTMHGIAVNCDPDLTAFDRIVPCGIPDADVTSLTTELGRRIGVLDAAPLLQDALRHRLGPLLRDGRHAALPDSA